MSLFNKKQSDIPRRRSADRDALVSTPSDIFKRNRTLTGTTSNNFGSADASAGLESSRVQVHHLAIHRRKVSIVLAAAVVASAFLWLIVSNFTATVSIVVQNADISKPVDNSRYAKVIQDYLNINPMGRFHFLLDQSALATYVTSQLPEVATISQRDMANFGKTDFVITMRVPVAGWKINAQQYYVDSKGVSFDKNYFKSPTVQIVDNSGASPQTGAVVSNRFLGFVGRVVSSAKSDGYTVTQAILPPNTTRELEIHLKNSNILVKLSIDRPAGEQIEDMSRALKYLSRHNITPGYIDVRVSGKAFYK